MNWGKLRDTQLIFIRLFCNIKTMGIHKIEGIEKIVKEERTNNIINLSIIPQPY
jgi:hypothetical protein